MSKLVMPIIQETLVLVVLVKFKMVVVTVLLWTVTVNHDYDLVDRLPAKNSLIWIKACLGGQELPAMIDSGANPNCLSLRCVQGSEWLRKVQRHQYSGKGIVDANGEPIQPSFVIKCCLTVGSPKIVVNTEFVVIQSLPFSCIIGQHTLMRFSSWEVSNTKKILTINRKQCCTIFGKWW